MGCQIIDINHLLGKKWTFLILQELYHKEASRFNEIKNGLNLTTNKIVSQRLQELENLSIINRSVIKKTPLSVQYSLTAKGKELLVIINKMKEWGIKHTVVSSDCVKNNCNQCLKLQSLRDNY